MIIEIEGVACEIAIKDKVISKNFDIRNGQYFSTTLFQHTITTPVYRYKDYDLLFCPIEKETQFIRFVLYNIKKQQSFILLDAVLCDKIKLFRLNETSFVILCTNNINTIMHCINLKESSVQSQEINLNTMHQIGFISGELIIVNNTMHKSNNNMHSIVLYKPSGEVLRIVLCIKSAHSTKLKYEYKGDELIVFDVHSTKVLLQEKIRI